MRRVTKIGKFGPNAWPKKQLLQVKISQNTLNDTNAGNSTNATNDKNSFRTVSSAFINAAGREKRNQRIEENRNVNRIWAFINAAGREKRNTK